MKAGHAHEARGGVREKALNLIALAQHPKLVPVNKEGWVREDTESADREAQLALAAAMVYLADALRESS